MNYLKFTIDKLSVKNVSELVKSSSCDKAVYFIDSKSGNFENKNDASLLCGSYEQKAVNTLTDLCHGMRNQWQSVENIAIYHRLGPVPFKEARIIIAISSPHRADALEAIEWCIEQLQNLVSIWKKEMYEEDSAEWKENKDFDRALDTDYRRDQSSHSSEYCGEEERLQNLDIQQSFDNSNRNL